MFDQVRGGPLLIVAGFGLVAISAILSLFDGIPLLGWLGLLYRELFALRGGTSAFIPIVATIVIRVVASIAFSKYLRRS